jgi:hypothetical protein
MPAHLCRFTERFESLHRLAVFLGSVNLYRRNASLATPRHDSPFVRGFACAP